MEALNISAIALFNNGAELLKSVCEAKFQLVYGSSDKLTTQILLV